MSFDSITFFLFLSIVFAAYWTLHGKTRWQNILLLVASYVFYGWWDWRFLGLILFTTLSSWTCALGMEKLGGVSGEKELKSLKGLKSASWLNAINIVTNLGILALFKYYDFFADSLNEALAGLGVTANWPLLHLVLPVGISFYTFQSLSYTIDVRRGHLRPTRDLISYASYIAFFPQLVAGPIERATRLLPQFENRRTFSNQEATEGCRMMLWGFFKKIVIADNCAITVEQIFGHYGELGTLTLLFGAMLFAFQIYADFSGYSDIAIGTARLFGIRLSPNFDQPYTATSIPDFWRRWHISLTSWFRDYVYIPLGGSRCSRLRTFGNTLVVFGMSGLWHGANWTFVAWGCYHGALFFPYNMRWIGRKRDEMELKGVEGKLRRVETKVETRVERGVETKVETGVEEKLKGVELKRWGMRVVTFLLVCIGWVLFRADSLQMAGNYLWRMASTQDFSLPPYSKSIVVYIALMLWAEWHHCVLPQRTWLRWTIYYVLAAIMLLKATQGSQFIYFQF